MKLLQRLPPAAAFGGASTPGSRNVGPVISGEMDHGADGRRDLLKH
jgi:hypothetical protein